MDLNKVMINLSWKPFFLDISYEYYDAILYRDDVGRYNNKQKEMMSHLR
jgi:hypothetical protein